MPPNARRRNFRIVAPLTPNREQEIVGGLKNALDRGETLGKAKQSFVNAGYKPEEVNIAAQKLLTINSQRDEFPITLKEARNQTTDSKYKISPRTTTKLPVQKKQASKKFMIILFSIAALVLVGAALLGIFWNNLFG